MKEISKVVGSLVLLVAMVSIFFFTVLAHADEKMSQDDFQKSKILQLEDQKAELEKQVADLRVKIQSCYEEQRTVDRNRQKAELIKKYKLGEKDVIDNTGKIVRAKTDKSSLTDKTVVNK
ncbi:MAG TPA: hypothetical protein VMW56_22830 [Candidatus Margulisiibacteriota bacterium]|nr:hypothetical protein [Candidatus Margulisiibacteriota bacterium]